MGLIKGLVRGCTCECGEAVDGLVRDALGGAHVGRVDVDYLQPPLRVRQRHLVWVSDEKEAGFECWSAGCGVESALSEPCFTSMWSSKRPGRRMASSIMS